MSTTALLNSVMNGQMEMARLLLNLGAQVNKPTGIESPLALVSYKGHLNLAMLLIERGNIEEVNDKDYTPLMQAARQGHEEMVALLLNQGAKVNAQTKETRETALALACCGGFMKIADFLIKREANIELGALTPLMMAAQKGHLDLVRYLLESGANLHAQTQTGVTVLIYACENSHILIADLLVEFGADLKYKSEGGITLLMNTSRAGYERTVHYLVSKGVNVNQQTTNNDHIPSSVTYTGDHFAVVEAQGSNSSHNLKDNFTMLIETAKMTTLLLFNLLRTILMA